MSGTVSMIVISFGGTKNETVQHHI